MPRNLDHPQAQRRLVVATRALRLDALAYLDQLKMGRRRKKSGQRLIG
jgi:hypothetical protein